MVCISQLRRSSRPAHKLATAWTSRIDTPDRRDYIPTKLMFLSSVISASKAPRCAMVDPSADSLNSVECSALDSTRISSPWLAIWQSLFEICMLLVPRSLYLGRLRSRYGCMGLVARLKRPREKGSVLMVVALSGMSRVVSRLTVRVSGVGSRSCALLTVRGVSSTTRWEMAGMHILKLGVVSPCDDV